MLDRTTDCSLVALERVKNSHRLMREKNGVASFSRLFLIKSISYLQVTITYVRACMSLKFGQIPLLVSMATDKVIFEKSCCHFFSAVYYPILFILAGNDECMRARRSSNFSWI